MEMKDKIEYIKYYGFEIRNGVFQRQSNVTLEYIVNREGEFIVEKPVKKIGKNAFSNCSKLEKIIFPIGVNEIGDKAFSRCTSLSELSFSPSDGEESFKDDTYLSSSTIIIPGEIKRIGKNAFEYCKSVRRVIFEEGVEVIEDNAFLECDILHEVVIPSSVIKIGSSAFMGCINLGRVVLSEGLKYIGEKAFYDCDSIYEFPILPKSIEYIGRKALFFTKNMLKTKLPDFFDTSDLKWFSERFQMKDNDYYFSGFRKSNSTWDYIRNRYLFGGSRAKHFGDYILDDFSLSDFIKKLEGFFYDADKAEKLFDDYFSNKEKKKASELFVIKYKRSKIQLSELLSKSEKNDKKKKEKAKKRENTAEIDALMNKYYFEKPKKEKQEQKREEKAIDLRFDILLLIALFCFNDNSNFGKSVFSDLNKCISSLLEIHSEMITKQFVIKYLEYAKTIPEDKITKLSKKNYETILEDAINSEDAELISYVVKLREYSSDVYYFNFDDVISESDDEDFY